MSIKDDIIFIMNRNNRRLTNLVVFSGASSLVVGLSSPPPEVALTSLPSSSDPSPKAILGILFSWNREEMIVAKRRFNERFDEYYEIEICNYACVKRDTTLVINVPIISLLRSV